MLDRGSKPGRGRHGTGRFPQRAQHSPPFIPALEDGRRDDRLTRTSAPYRATAAKGQMESSGLGWGARQLATGTSYRPAGDRDSTGRKGRAQDRRRASFPVIRGRRDRSGAWRTQVSTWEGTCPGAGGGDACGTRACNVVREGGAWERRRYDYKDGQDGGGRAVVDSVLRRVLARILRAGSSPHFWVVRGVPFFVQRYIPLVPALLFCVSRLYIVLFSAYAAALPRSAESFRPN